MVLCWHEAVFLGCGCDEARFLMRFVFVCMCFVFFSFCVFFAFHVCIFFALDLFFFLFFFILPLPRAVAGAMYTLFSSLSCIF